MTASIVASAPSAFLPTPVVRAGRIGPTAPAYFIPDGSPVSASSGVQVNVVNPVSVSTHGLPQIILDEPDAWLPKLELLRYVRKRTGSNGYPRSLQNAGYVHPSHGPAPSGNGSHTHGGVHGFATSYTQSLRATEWDAGQWGTEIDVTQGMLGFMHFTRCQYLDATGSRQDITLPVPSGSSSNNNFGKRFPYSGAFRPGYYKFRWSVIDPTDPRGQRISGPVGDTVSLTTEIFPFVPDTAFIGGTIEYATATVDPRFDPRQLRAWIGSTSRLPR